MVNSVAAWNDRWKEAPEAIPLRRLDEYLRRCVIEHNPSEWILDIGSGPCRLSRALHADGYKVIALDHSGEAVKRCVDAGVQARPLDLNGITEGSIAEPTYTFDLALLVEVLEHVDDPSIVLRWAAANAGAVLGSVPFGPAGDDQAHVHEWLTDDEFREFVAACDLRLVWLYTLHNAYRQGTYPALVFEVRRKETDHA